METKYLNFENSKNNHDRATIHTMCVLKEGKLRKLTTIEISGGFERISSLLTESYAHRGGINPLRAVTSLSG